MAITYRTAGAWGAGKGGNLDAAEIDANFYELAQAIVALDAGPQPAEIDTITVTGNQMTITLSDLTVFGPYTLPRATFTWRDDWTATTAYYANDIVRVGARLYLVAYDHTSESTFDAAFQLSGETSVAYILMASADPFGALSELSDVEIASGGPADGEFLVFDGSSGVAKWTNQVVSLGATSLNGLSDVTLTSPANGEVLLFDSVTSQWLNDTLPASVTTLDGLSDVEIASGGAADNDFLRWDNGAAAWVNEDPLQSSATDTTAGKILTVGAFGLGLDAGQIVTNLDTHYTSGLFSAYGGAHASAPAGTNPFPSLNGAFGLLCGNSTIGTSSEYIWQIAVKFTNSAPEIYYRARFTSWTSWTAIAGSSLALDGLTDVEIASGGPSHGDVLTWDSVASAWVNDTIAAGSVTESLVIAASDEVTAISAGTGKTTFRMPYAFTLSGVRASLTSACATGTFTVDINEGGTSILSTKLTIDATEKTSTTAATAAVISDSALAEDAEITIDVDNAGDGTATGLKVVLIGVQA